MKTVYDMVDGLGRQMQATYENGKLRVTMTFIPEKGLTMEEVSSIMGWSIVNSKEYEEPKIIPFKRKED